MRVLWLAWKDINHPTAGGAEVVLWELSKRMIADGHDVTVLTCGYDRDGRPAPEHDVIDGVRIIRVGSSRYLHSFQALAYYLRHLRGKYDRVIETVNTAVYFSVLFGGRGKRYLLCHQLAREIWFYETKLPLSYVGYYLLEPLALRLLSLAHVPVMTVSESSKRDLERFGFRPDLTRIISEGTELQPAKDLEAITKYDRPTLLSLGALRAMKRTLDQVAAFEAAKVSMPDLQLKIAGVSDDSYGKRVLERVAASPYKDDIEYLGRVSQEDKISLMQRCHLILVTSIKEGWGLIVTEAASQGTPAVVYDADGLRDSVRDGETGLVVMPVPAPTALAEAVAGLLADKPRYQRMRAAAWEWSRRITFDRSYIDFKGVVEL